MIRCDVCNKGKLAAKVIRHFDATALVGIPLTVSRMSAHVCGACGAVFPDGGALDRLVLVMARQIATSSASLSSSDARFLRKFLGLTQAELAERLGVERVTVARWEGKNFAVLDGPSGLALRGAVAGKLLVDGHLEAGAVANLRAPTRGPVKGVYKITEKDLRAVA